MTGTARFRREGKIIGCNLYWISAAAVSVFLFLRFTGGNLIDWDSLGFEVVFPFFTAVMTGECGRTRSDPMFEVIEAQSTSLFRWVLLRYAYVFSATGLFSVSGMLAVRLFRPAAAFGGLLFVYLTTACFFPSLAVLCSLLSRSAHTAAAVCGVFWLFCLLAKGMLRFPAVSYFYPFLRFADESSPVLVWSKCVLTGMSLVIWLAVFAICKKRAILSRQ